jgi:hypothetical protein
VRCAVIDAARAEEDVAHAIFDVILSRLIAPAAAKQARRG